MAAKRAKSRKSVAYHAARKAAKERGLSDEAAKEEAKLDSCRHGVERIGLKGAVPIFHAQHFLCTC